VAGSGKALKDKLFETIQPQGFGIKVDKDGYTIVAVALDGSPVSRRGPQAP